MFELVRFVVSLAARRFRSRAVLELENLALRHQVHVLRRHRPGRLRLLAIDRWLWVWLYRLWPRCLVTLVLVKPATIVQWHRQGFRLFWPRNSNICSSDEGPSTQHREATRVVIVAFAQREPARSIRSTTSSIVKWFTPCAPQLPRPRPAPKSESIF
jgi:hypothetical protein